MSDESHIKAALLWITSTLNRKDIPFQIVGGLAAKCYGSSRPLHDVDIYVPSKEISKLEKELNDYIELGPKHYKDENWNLVFMKLNYNGQLIEIADSDNTKYFDSKSNRWIKEEINFKESNFIEFESIKLPVMPKQDLIDYKKRLDRKVDRIDIREIES